MSSGRLRSATRTDACANQESTASTQLRLDNHVRNFTGDAMVTRKHLVYMMSCVLVVGRRGVAERDGTRVPSESACKPAALRASTHARHGCFCTPRRNATSGNPNLRLMADSAPSENCAQTSRNPEPSAAGSKTGSLLMRLASEARSR